MLVSWHNVVAVSQWWLATSKELYLHVYTILLPRAYVELRELRSLISTKSDLNAAMHIVIILLHAFLDSIVVHVIQWSQISAPSTEFETGAQFVLDHPNCDPVFYQSIIAQLLYIQLYDIFPYTILSYKLFFNYYFSRNKVGHHRSCIDTNSMIASLWHINLQIWRRLSLWQ